MTTAPKGDAMFDIIKNGSSNEAGASERMASPPRRTFNVDESTLLRAPGLSSTASATILRSLARASTMPAEFRPQDSVDFEPFNGSSLFSNFRRSMTTEDKIRQWQRNQLEAARSETCAATLPNDNILAGCRQATLASVPGRNIRYAEDALQHRSSLPFRGTTSAKIKSNTDLNETKQVVMTSSGRPSASKENLSSLALPPMSDIDLIREEISKLHLKLRTLEYRAQQDARRQTNDIHTNGKPSSLEDRRTKYTARPAHNSRNNTLYEMR